MRIAVLMKEVPDLIEELELTPEGRLETDVLSYIPSEWDEQALEEALILKEESGAAVTVVAVDSGQVDEMLYTALAKGADRAVKLAAESEVLTNRARAALMAAYLQQDPYDLVLTGVQAVDDLDGQVAGLLGGQLGWPHASVVREVKAQGERVQCVQEYAGGWMSTLELALPAVLGIQAARRPPRYVSVAKVRQLQKTASLETVEVTPLPAVELPVRRLYRPAAAGHATMWSEDAAEAAAQLVELLQSRKLIRS